ncbi:Putative glycosyl hydrolase, family 13, catalytic domain, alpha-amylase, Alpha-amylase, domain C [Septoria linicola]|uniref:alpha-amylase n=1 Tax=Septoria linicola TaxID=215465 RepID=A0A9Q9EP73_9PEZI|nr:putative glycosyl hydrolase, family 13, catalytic domain, alpha-amylase, Alpha-amylase, domain C [Septoria linicola]USW57810.1 Putative glycosyl hydrolase, family 13, catalytic domain, alpha-amylase, Alpha-amylase, domain C [Septoria linicola]
MTSGLGLLATVFAFSAMVQCLTPVQWRTQSIYQVMTDRFARSDGSTTAPCNLNEYCGGTWVGLINQLDYIQQMGFTAVWISPIVKNKVQSSEDGNSYHGYWAQDLYSVNSQFGSAADLRALSDELHSRGMYLMVDVVPNHMASYSSRSTVDYSQLNPFNQQSYYHQPCKINLDDPNTVEQCWMGSDTVSLPDLKTEEPTVASMWQRWVSQLVSDFSIDGLRIDTAVGVNQGFWSGFQAAAGGMHVLAEVWNGNPNELCPYQNYLTGMMNYAAYYWIVQSFQNSSASMTTLASNINWIKYTCSDTTLLGSFLENHDNPRFASFTSSITRIKNAMAFQMLSDGIPIVYQGQEQKFSGGLVPSNREALWLSGFDRSTKLYVHIQKLNQIRSWAIFQDAGYVTFKSTPTAISSTTIVMRKGNAGKQIVGVYNNWGPDYSGTVTVSSSSSGFTENLAVTEILLCTSMMTDSRGNLGLAITNGQAQVLYPTASLANSGVCGL